MRGVDILVFVNTGTEEAPVWEAAGGQRNATLSESSEALDVTTKDGGAGSYEYEYGLYGWSISGDGIYVPNDLVFQMLKKAMRQRIKVKVRMKEAGTFTQEGIALVSSLDTEAPYDDSATYSMEFQGTGFLTDIV
jgi:TP901-1 family phage major tail protein